MSIDPQVWMTFLTQEEKQMMIPLNYWMQGRDIYGERLRNTLGSPAAEMQMQSDAIRQYQAIVERAQARAQDFEKHGRSGETHEVELRQKEFTMQIESEKLNIERARVVVQALQVAAKAGISGNQLLEAIQGFTEKLLPGPEQAVRMIEGKKNE